jgi:hypothetical protein
VIAVILGVGALSLQACDPCLGAVACRAASHAAVDGRVITGEVGVAVAGARMDLIAVYAATRDSTTVSTDGSGLFALRLATSSEPVKRLSLRVRPAGMPGYLIDSLPCGPVTINGDACVLGPIVPAPWVPIHLQLTYRNTVNTYAVNALVTFNRTGGAAWFGPNASESFTATTDSQAGVALPFPDSVYANSMDPVVGDLVVRLPPPFGSSIRHGFLVQPVYTFIDRPLYGLFVGPSLDYRLVFVDSAARGALSGVDVQFQRTAGIQTDPQGFHLLTDSSGTVRVRIRPLATGGLQGDLTIRPPNTITSTTIVGFVLPTFDTDSSLVIARWQVGKTGIIYPLPTPGPP